MKNNSQYRFNIQFTARSDDEIRAGEFLNSLGRRKSTFIIAAVIEYLTSHPELLADPKQIHVSTVSVDQLESKIRAIVEEKLSSLPAEHKSRSVPAAEVEQISTDIADMLDDLELFSSF